MRLTCPNCGAQYEVPDDVIPAEGRDVQCSNCGDTWFQAHSDAAQPTAIGDETSPESDLGTGIETDVEAAAVAEPDLAAAEISPPSTAETPAEEEIPTAVPVSVEPSDPPSDSGPDLDAAVEASHEATEPHADPAPHGHGLARGMDPAITGILRQEAKREAELRAAETAGVESQPDLGLEELSDDEPSRRARQARDRMARMQGENTALLAAAESGSRRGLLPDIEEINSTLRAGHDPAAPAAALPTEAIPPRRKSGFSRGFAVVLLLVLALVMTYANAPQIAQSLPQVDPYLSAFVATVDQARLWLDAQANGILTP